MDPQRESQPSTIESHIAISEKYVKGSQPATDILPVRPADSATKADKHPERLVLPAGRRILIPVSTGGSKVPLYAIPSLSLALSDFKTLATLLDEQQPFSVFQYPYWQSTVSDSAVIQEIAGNFAAALNDYQPHGPVAVCGWSIGTIVALELAQQLRAAGRDVALLVAIDWAPENTGIQSVKQRFLYSKRAWAYEKWKTRDSLSSLTKILFNTLRDCWFKEPYCEKTEESTLPTIVKNIWSIPGLTDLQKTFIMRFYKGACNYVPKSYTGDVLLFVASYSVHQRDEEKWARLAPNLESVRLKGTHATIVRWRDAGNLIDHLSRHMTKVSTRAEKALCQKNPEYSDLL
jgi:thioesterase domain-containing protein